MTLESTSPKWMIYGATGYTGELISREIVRRGLQPILAGRQSEKVEKLAKELNCDWRAFDLSDANNVALQLSECQLVLNCAGPFSATAKPVIDACLHVGAHYLDITGEIDVIERAASLSSEAKQRNVCLIPAVGFDVVPSDCLAALLAQKLPTASHLKLAIWMPMAISPGTSKTIAEAVPKGGRVRVGGEIRKVPLAWKSERFAFRRGKRNAITMPWGDVATAYHSTGIPNIEVYMAIPRAQVRALKTARWIRPLLGLSPIQRVWKSHITRNVTGPTEEQRNNGFAALWGRVWNEKGQSAEATLDTPEAYNVTVLTAVAAVQRMLTQAPGSGYYAPAKAFGAEFILQFPGVVLNWVE